MSTLTTNYSLIKPGVFGELDAWGPMINSSFDIIDTQMKVNADAAAAKIPKLLTATVVDNLVGWADTGGDSLKDLGVGIANVARRNSTNTFVGNQTVTGNISASGDSSAATFTEGGTLLSTKYATAAAMTAALALKSDKGVVDGIRTVTTTGDLLLADAGCIVESNSGSGIVLTVQPQATIAWAVRTRIDLVRFGAGSLTIAAGAGVTVNSKSGLLTLAGQYSGATLYRRGTNDWVLIGDLG